MTTALAMTRCLLGETLRGLGITQAALAAEAGMSAGDLCRICSGYQIPQVGKALVICDALEALTGHEFDVSDLWVLASVRPVRRAKRGRVPWRVAA